MRCSVRQKRAHTLLAAATASAAATTVTTKEILMRLRTSTYEQCNVMSACMCVCACVTLFQMKKKIEARKTRHTKNYRFIINRNVFLYDSQQIHIYVNVLNWINHNTNKKQYNDHMREKKIYALNFKHVLRPINFKSSASIQAVGTQK